tara:strand:- start:2025 stop:2228 length:204 start_codon:yes stop_codon:yes gene_type:complete
MSDFNRTARGQKFYDRDLPRLVSVLENIGNQLQSLNEREERKFKLDERLKRQEIKKNSDELNEDNKG